MRAVTPKDFINSVFDDCIKKLPARLIDLDNNKMVKKSDLTDELNDKRVECIKALASKDRAEWDEFVKETIGPRVRFAIFSHRWSGSEPSFAEATEHVGEWLNGVSDDAPTGVKKLVNFCDKAKNVHNLHLAWSDTCCIDKTDKTEEQEAINSMFRWYRDSDLCIAHLAETKTFGDVRGKGEWDDQWFTRGWTLQELIAPRAMKFYTKEWEVLLPGVVNDKDDQEEDSKELLQMLKKTTGIQLVDIMHFQPGPDRLTQKMIWASQRTTTKDEDKAYSLLGIFDVGMYISYGEGIEEAFYRLQEQIIKTTRDKGLFEWYGKPSKRCSMLASLPRCFLNAKDGEGHEHGNAKDYGGHENKLCQHERREHDGRECEPHAHERGECERRKRERRECELREGERRDGERRGQIMGEETVQRSLLTKVFCFCSGLSFWTSCMVQTFSCAVRFEVLVQSGEVINQGESHFAVTNNGLQIKVDTIRVLNAWRLPRKDGHHRRYLTCAGYERVKVAFARLLDGKSEELKKKDDQFVLVPLTDEMDEEGQRRKARVAVLLYQVDNNTWKRVITKEPIFLKRKNFQVVSDNLLHTIYIR
jgi:hypothetical protein